MLQPQWMLTSTAGPEKTGRQVLYLVGYLVGTTPQRVKVLEP